MQCIYIFTPQEAEIVGNSRQCSSVINSLGSFFMVPHKSSSCLWLFPFPLYDNFKNSYLFASPGPTNIATMTRQHTQFPLTFVYSIAPRPQTFHEIPTHRDILVHVIGVSQIHPPVSSVNFSNNISIPQVRVSIKKLNFTLLSRSLNY